MDSQRELERASRALTEGKFVECAAICGAIVAQDARNALATHLLGLAIKETGDWPQGEQWLRLSVQLEPARAEFHANLANLLRRRKKYRQAEQSYRRALELAPDHRPAQRSLALTLNDLGRAPEAEALCRALIAADEGDPESWVLLGIALASLKRFPESEAAYRRAIALDPDNSVAHHNLGALLSQTQRPDAALAALENAGRLGVDSYELAFNRGRALLETYDLEGAEREFERAAALQPLNIEGQLQLARVRHMRGDPKFARSLARVADANPDNVGLRRLFAEVLWRAGNLEGAEAVLRDLIARGLGTAQVRSTLAAVLQEAGLLKEAEAFATEAARAQPADGVIVEILVSILLARGLPEDAMPFIETRRALSPDSQAWLAYEATAARLLDRDRYQYLCDYERFVQVYEVAPATGWSSIEELNAALREALAERHRFRARPLDQTLRNGTQTARSLLADTHPAVKAILGAFMEPIEQYRRSLDVDARHPLYATSRGGMSRFTGAWSVRLHRGGYHVNHFHPEGWLSSAYYVDTPPESDDPQMRQGWIKFGEPRYPAPGTPAERFVQPKPGRLVLFPSYMWHGTTPIHGDTPRLTIAFDVKPD
ncbi:MAG TPA: tetratricopeptide repeat protein [Steroidobacteraceae bacterium]|nr:tetratricopeptide repeat protein [Steroidobacteraceae bacterium]